MQTSDYDLARGAARAAWLRLGQTPWSSQDWEDAVQDAALEMFKARRVAVVQFAGDEERQRRYIFGAAKRAALVGWLRRTMAHNPADPYPLDFSEWLEAVEPESDSSRRLSERQRADLLALFCAGKKQKQGRAVAACARNVEIVDLLVQGYRNESIAVALGVPVNSVKKYRAEIKAALRLEAARRGIPIGTANHVSPATGQKEGEE